MEGFIRDKVLKTTAFWRPERADSKPRGYDLRSERDDFRLKFGGTPKETKFSRTDLN